LRKTRSKPARTAPAWKFWPIEEIPLLRCIAFDACIVADGSHLTSSENVRQYGRNMSGLTAEEKRKRHNERCKARYWANRDRERERINAWNKRIESREAQDKEPISKRTPNVSELRKGNTTGQIVIKNWHVERYGAKPIKIYARCGITLTVNTTLKQQDHGLWQTPNAEKPIIKHGTKRILTK
jgi:hypothetical protein